MQINDEESHFTVTVPSTSLSQKQDPERFRPQSAFCIMIQLAINLKFRLVAVIVLRTLIKKRIYIIADLVSPYLCFIYIVVFFVKVIRDNSVDFFLYEWSDIIKDCLICLIGYAFETLENIKIY